MTHDIDVQKLRKLCDAASPGPWTVKGNSCGGATLVRGEWLTHPQSHLQIVPEVDAEFIAAARDAVPALLTALAEMQSKIDTLVEEGVYWRSEYLRAKAGME